ncbi:hypothetical protein [Streptomyces toxytricini]|uniref:hypothetical protein n=1 Tax=Streptomyces toxytricini TaxID=67369 RepID=UPI00342D2905
MTAKLPNRRLLGLAAATLAVAAATATPVTASPSVTSPTASVSPTSAAPGSRVSLTLRGCATRAAKATSTAFGDARLAPAPGDGTALFGSATVYTNASTGAHSVTFDCGDGSRITVSLQVTSGAARGGTGGSIGGADPALIAVGGTLAASALGAGVWVLRRRTRTT